MAEKVILGIDPGTSIMGYGVIQVIEGKQLGLVNSGVIHLSKYQDPMVKLRKIFERSLNLMESYKPDEVAIEAPFYGKNVQSMLKLGRAQGVSMAAALYRDIPIFEYAPRKIKQALTSNGNASKEQVAGMVGQLLNMKDKPEYLDATDGIAAAICRHFQSGNAGQSAGKSYNSWKSFLKDNPGKMK